MRFILFWRDDSWWIVRSEVVVFRNCADCMKSMRLMLIFVIVVIDGVAGIVGVILSHEEIVGTGFFFTFFGINFS